MNNSIFFISKIQPQRNACKLTQIFLLLFICVILFAENRIPYSPVDTCAKIDGEVWLDLNSDGIYQDGENGINGVSILLYDAMSKKIVAVQLTKTKEGTSSDDGWFSFDCIPSGMYYLKFDVSKNLEASAAFQGNDKSKDSEVTHFFGVNTSNKYTVNNGDSINVDGGFHCKSSVGNYVWLDDNKNGIQEVEDFPMGGIYVGAYDLLGRLITETRSNENGYYILKGLCEGEYFLKFDKPDIYAFTLAHKGTEDVDSDVDGTNGEGTTRMFTVSDSTVMDDMDAGLVFKFLGLDILNFSVEAQLHSNYLHWTLNSINSFSTIYVERKIANENDFSILGTIGIQANNSKHYTFVDENIQQKGNYCYRLKIVSNRGEVKYSSIVSVRIQNDTNNLIIQMSPNPANVFLDVQIIGWNGPNFSIDIFNAYGQLLYQDNVLNTNKRDKIGSRINLAKFNSGIYYITIKNEEFSTTNKFQITK